MLIICVLINVNPSAYGELQVAASQQYQPLTQGLSLWLKADVGVTMNGSNKVSVWSDQSGKGNHLTQGTASKQPVLLTDAINGYPVVRFDGIDDSLEKSLTTPHNGSSSVFIVMKVNAVGQTYNNGIFTTTITANPNSYAIINNSANPGRLMVAKPNANCPINTQVPTKYTIVGAVIDVVSGNIKTYENGILYSNVTNTAFENFNIHDAYALGRSYRVPPFCMNADVAEILVYERTVDDNERQSIENYLQNKYYGWATKPFKVLQAEDYAYSGILVDNSSEQSVSAAGTPVVVSGGQAEFSVSSESWGRKAVKLTSQNDFIDFIVPETANAIVVRACIPDKLDNNNNSIGIDGSLTLQVKSSAQGFSNRNVIVPETNTSKSTLTVSSKLCWNYTDNVGESPTSNIKRTYAGNYYDDCRYLIQDGVQAGDTIRLKANITNEFTWCIIDLIELENVPLPLAIPTGYLDVRHYGAVANDGRDDTVAFVNCLNDARDMGKGVYIPRGTFNTNSQLDVSGVTIKGAGMWYSKIFSTFTGYGVLRLGASSELYDFSIFGNKKARSVSGTGHALSGNPSNAEVMRVWIEKCTTGGWIGTGSNSLFKNLRIKNLAADGINFNRGSTDITVTESYFRNCGDDSIASYASTDNWGGNTPQNNLRITMSNNTVKLGRWGHGLAAWGGDTVVMERNYIQDQVKMPGIHFITNGNLNNFEFTNCIITNNIIIRCGGNGWNQQKSALEFHMGSSKLCSNNLVSHNMIINPLFKGIGLGGGGSGLDIVFVSNQINMGGQGTSGVFHSSITKGGSVTYEKNTVSNIKPGQHVYHNLGTLAVTLIDNTPNNWGN